MRTRTPVLLTPLIFTAALGGPALAAPGASAPPPPATPSAAAKGSGFHHFHHYGYYHHYSHYRHYGHGSAYVPTTTSPDGGDGQSFEQGGRRYYWYTRNGHRFYSSRPQPGATLAGPDLGVSEDLDEPLSPEERAQRAARMQHAQARLAAVEKRVAKQRHLLRLRLMAAKPKTKRK